MHFGRSPAQHRLRLEDDAARRYGVHDLLSHRPAHAAQIGRKHPRHAGQIVGKGDRQLGILRQGLRNHHQCELAVGDRRAGIDVSIVVIGQHGGQIERE